MKNINEFKDIPIDHVKLGPKRVTFIPSITLSTLDATLKNTHPIEYVKYPVEEINHEPIES